MTEIAFKRTPRADGSVEFRIVLPPLPENKKIAAQLAEVAIDFKGDEARRVLNAWAIAYVGGLALISGWTYLESQLRDLSDSIEEAEGRLDRERQH